MSHMFSLVLLVIEMQFACMQHCFALLCAKRPDCR